MPTSTPKFMSLHEKQKAQTENGTYVPNLYSRERYPDCPWLDQVLTPGVISWARTPVAPYRHDNSWFMPVDDGRYFSEKCVGLVGTPNCLLKVDKGLIIIESIELGDQLKEGGHEREGEIGEDSKGSMSGVIKSQRREPFHWSGKRSMIRAWRSLWKNWEKKPSASRRT